MIASRTVLQTAGILFHSKVFHRHLETFYPRKVVILSKLTRYQYEKRRLQHSSEEDLQEILGSRGSDYQGLLRRHKQHQKTLRDIEHSLQARGIEVRTTLRFDYTPQLVDWADLVISAGGDGTFLLAASKILDQKPMIGVNTDPEGSHGHLCLPRRFSLHFPEALDRLLAGKFRWYFRQRMQITLSGRNSQQDPVELHDQQLKAYEYRWFDHEIENQQSRQRQQCGISEPAYRVLPVLALNEVFIGESNSAKVSYYEISVDGSPFQKQKSSGVIICSGTGSNSWCYNINKLSEQTVSDLLKIAALETGSKINVPSDILKNITRRFNDSVTFDPSELKMSYTVRDPVVNAVFSVRKSRGFAQKKIVVRSRCWDACLVIDGGLSFRFNDGDIATLQINPDRALRTVLIDDD